MSRLSATTAFIAGIDERDTFLGRRRCVICGTPRALEHCQIIWGAEPEFVSPGRTI